MNDIHVANPQDLRARFAGIISMMLVILRAHGLRALIHLPALWLVEREMRRIAAAFCEMFAAWQAGLILLPSARDRPATAPVRACTQSAAQSRNSARPATPRVRRQPAPAKPARAAGSGRGVTPRAASITHTTTARHRPGDRRAKKSRLGRLALAHPLRYDLATTPAVLSPPSPLNNPKTPDTPRPYPPPPPCIAAPHAQASTRTDPTRSARPDTAADSRLRRRTARPSPPPWATSARA